MLIDPDDPALTYRGAISLQNTPTGMAPWRVPHDQPYLYLPRGRVGRLAMPSGVRICLRTDSPWVECRYHVREMHPQRPEDILHPPEVPRLDVYSDGALVTSVELQPSGDGTCRVNGLPAREKALEIWLPTYHQFRLRGLGLKPQSMLRAETRQSPQWIHYGSSTCQGRGAASPSSTWPALVARTAGLDLTSLAVGAGCYLQPMFARLIRDLPADLITCLVGMNELTVGGLYSLPSNLVGFVQVIRERHARVPIIVVSPTLIPYWEQPPQLGGDSLPDYRVETERVVELLRRQGDQNVHYLDGRSLFGPGQAHLFLEHPVVGQVHPNAEGHRVMADHMLTALRLLAGPMGAERRISAA